MAAWARLAPSFDEDLTHSDTYILAAGSMLPVIFAAGIRTRKIKWRVQRRSLNRQKKKKKKANWLLIAAAVGGIFRAL